MKRARLIWCLLAIAAIGCLYLVSWHFARGGIHYFSPYTLQTHAQSEILVPVLYLPIYRSSRETYHYKLVEYLIDSGYWTPTEEESPPMRTSRWNMQWKDGESDIHKQLSWYAEGWIAWSKEHPDVAAKLWPLVLKLIRSDSSDVRSNATPLMHFARHATTPSELDQIIARFPDLAAAVAKLK